MAIIFAKGYSIPLGKEAYTPWQRDEDGDRTL